MTHKHLHLALQMRARCTAASSVSRLKLYLGRVAMFPGSRVVPLAQFALPVSRTDEVSNRHTHLHQLLSNISRRSAAGSCSCRIPRACGVALDLSTASYAASEKQVDCAQLQRVSTQLTSLCNKIFTLQIG